MAITDITTLTGLNVQPQTDLNGTIPNSALHGFYVPSLTTAQITTLLTKSEMRNGAIVYDNVLNVLRTYKNGVLNTLGTSLGTATGVGLTSGSPFIFPSGTNGGVEVAGNQVNGFTYYGTTSNTLRSYVDGAWVTITVA